MPAPPPALPPQRAAAEQMTAEDLQRRLQDKLSERGVANALKARVRSMLFEETVRLCDGSVTPERPRKGVGQRAADTLVLEHLRISSYGMTRAVFVAEADLAGPSAALPLVDAHRVLASTDSDHPTVAPLLAALLEQGRSRMTSAGVQATHGPHPDRHRLDDRLRSIDEAFQLRRQQTTAPSIEESLRRVQREEDETVRKRVAAEVERRCAAEVAEARAQEAMKFDRLLAERCADSLEQQRRMEHDMKLERFELQARQRELAVKATELDKERADFAVSMSSREQTIQAMHKEHDSRLEALRQSELRCTALSAELAATRAELDSMRSRVSRHEEDVRRLQRRYEDDAASRQEDWSRWQNEKNDLLRQYEHKMTENDLTLQNEREVMRRDFADRERVLRSHLDQERADDKERLDARRAALEAEAAEAAQAKLSILINQLQQQQTGFCSQMLDAQVSLENRRVKQQERLSDEAMRTELERMAVASERARLDREKEKARLQRARDEQMRRAPLLVGSAKHPPRIAVRHPPACEPEPDHVSEEDDLDRAVARQRGVNRSAMAMSAASLSPLQSPTAAPSPLAAGDPAHSQPQGSSPRERRARSSSGWVRDSEELPQRTAPQRLADPPAHPVHDRGAQKRAPAGEAAGWGAAGWGAAERLAELRQEELRAEQEGERQAESERVAAAQRAAVEAAQRVEQEAAERAEQEAAEARAERARAAAAEQAAADARRAEEAAAEAQAAAQRQAAAAAEALAAAVAEAQKDAAAQAAACGSVVAVVCSAAAADEARAREEQRLLQEQQLREQAEARAGLEASETSARAACEAGATDPWAGWETRREEIDAQQVATLRAIAVRAASAEAACTAAVACVAAGPVLFETMPATQKFMLEQDLLRERALAAVQEERRASQPAAEREIAGSDTTSSTFVPFDDGQSSKGSDDVNIFGGDPW